MPDINSYISYFETLTNKPELSSENFKEATNMLIGMIKDVNQEKLIHAKDGGKVRALGSINSIYLSIFNKITESSGQKAPFGQPYEDMKKSAAESLHEQPQEYQELFKQLDNFRKKFIENSTNISQESKEEATKLNATYQQEEIAKAALTEIETMAIKVKRDMLEPQIKKNKWLDPVDTAQAIKFLNDQFNSIEKATNKNTKLSTKDKENVIQKINETKLTFRKSIIKLSPKSERFIETIDNSKLDIGKLESKSSQERKDCLNQCLNNLKTAKGSELGKAVKEAQLLRYEVKILKRNKNITAQEKSNLNEFSKNIKEELKKTGNLDNNKVQNPNMENNIANNIKKTLIMMAEKIGSVSYPIRNATVLASKNIKSR